MFVQVREAVPRAMLVIAEEGPAREPLRRLTAGLGLQGHVHARTWSSAAMAGRVSDLYRSVTEPANSVARCAQRM
jgi:hypothetical protein